MLIRTRRTGIRPIEIGREVIALMDEQAQSGVDQVAHRYTIGLHKNDLAALSDAAKPLLSELRQAITNHAAFENYTLSGPAEVVMIEDVALKFGFCRVQIAPLSKVNPTEMISQVAQEKETRTESAIVLADGSRYVLTGDLVTIGRQSTCTIAIADNNISRLHAELRFQAGGWVIEDRGSTNGTRIDGKLVEEPMQLVGGENIAFGSFSVRFEQA